MKRRLSLITILALTLLFAGLDEPQPIADASAEASIAFEWARETGVTAISFEPRAQDPVIDCVNLCAVCNLEGLIAFNLERDQHGCVDDDCSNAVAEMVSAKETCRSSTAPSCNCHD